MTDKKVNAKGRNTGKAKGKKSKVAAAVVTIAAVAATEASASGKYIFEGDDFFSMIDAIERDAKSIMFKVDYGLRCAALHHAHYGDTRALNRIFHATKKLVHKNTVALWIRENCAVIYSKEDDAFKHSYVKIAVIKEDLNDYARHVDQAPAYYDLAKPDANPFKGFDLAAEANKLLAMAKKMLEAKETGLLKKGKEEVELSADERELIKVPLADLQALRRVFASTTETVIH